MKVENGQIKRASVHARRNGKIKGKTRNQIIRKGHRRWGLARIGGGAGAGKSNGQVWERINKKHTGNKGRMCELEVGGKK